MQILAVRPRVPTCARAEVQPDGSLGPWIAAGTLPVGLSVTAAQQYGCQVYMLGGLTEESTDEPFSDRILRGSIGADGSFTNVTVDAAKLSIKRGHVHQTPVWKNFIYSIGGRGNEGTSLGTIDIGTFTQ